MRLPKVLSFIACQTLILFLLTGCWNYREVEKLAVVSGIAIDKKDGHFLLTVEIVDIKGGKDTKISTKLLTTEGITIFDAARNTIKIAGKRLYFSHAEIVVVSREIAEESIIPILDWISRDGETRYSLHFLISREKSAREILEQKPITQEVLSFELNDMLEAQKSLSNAINIEEWQFLNELSAPGISTTLPTVDLTIDNNRLTPEIIGAGVFKRDRLVGFLNGNETKMLLFVRDKIKGGILAGKEFKDESVTNISLEIFKNKTKIKPSYKDGTITIDISMETQVALGENGGETDYIDEPGRTELKKKFEAKLENDIVKLVKKAQDEYDSDIFGFGKVIQKNMPGLWKQVQSDWDKLYKNVEVKVHSTIDIKNSAFQSKPIKVGD